MSSPIQWHEVLRRKGLSENSLPEFVAEVLKELGIVPSPFMVSLEGTPGAGKTTLVRMALRSIGLDPREPVTSPTFSYFNTYEIGGHSYYHCDFYRGPGVIDMDEAGLEINDETAGVFVEWAEFNPALNTHLQTTHRIVIESAQGLGTRDYVLFRRAVVSPVLLK